jgi:hypothetical protein
MYAQGIAASRQSAFTLIWNILSRSNSGALMELSHIYNAVFGMCLEFLMLM